MFEYEIIEVEENEFNHFIHHYDECEDDILHFNEEFDCMDVLAGCAEEIYWN